MNTPVDGVVFPIGVVLIDAKLAAPVTESVVNTPAAGVVPPMEVPLIVPPVMATADEACVEMVPRPRLVLAVVILARSDRLLVANNAPMAVAVRVVFDTAVTNPFALTVMVAT